MFNNEEADVAKETMLSRKTKKINLGELRELLALISDSELYSYIAHFIAEGVLVPVKTSGTNGNLRYLLYNQYRIVTKKAADDRISEITQLNPTLLKNGYLMKNQSVFLSHYDDILAVSAYLFKSEARSVMSKKERSFDIFGEEKTLDAIQNILSKIGATPDVLGYYETPEYCFNDYISKRKREMTLLICENKDIWFNIRRRMYEDNACVLFGKSIDGVVYGNGNKISGGNSLTYYTQFMDAESVTYLYWGDIDRAGLLIFQQVKAANPDLSIKLFVEGYCRMLELADGRVIPNSTNNRGLSYDFSDIYSLFPGEYRAKMEFYINENKRLPQEIVNYQILLNEMT